EFAAWAPAKPGIGISWTVPEGVGRKFSRVLGPSDEDSMPRPKEVEAVQFTGTVKSIEDGIAYVSYAGRIKGAHETQSNKGKCYGDATLTGAGAYDLKAQRMLSITLVFDGVFRNVKPYDQPANYSGVAEWRMSSK